MAQKIINLTLMLVLKETEDVWQEYPKHPEQSTFYFQQLRHRLIDLVLSKIPNYYTILEEKQEPPKDPTLLYRSPEEQVRLKNLIRENMVELILENADQTIHHLPQRNKKP